MRRLAFLRMAIGTQGEQGPHVSSRFERYKPLALVLLALTVPDGGCQGPAGGDLHGQSAAPPLAVEWGGCAGVRMGPVCELGLSRVITLWSSDPTSRTWVFATDRGALSATKTTSNVDGGIRFTIDVPPAATKLQIRGPHDEPIWSLQLAKAMTHDEIDRLLAVGRSGNYQEAIRSLQSLRERTQKSEHAFVDAAIGRMAVALGKLDRAEPALRASVAAAKADGRCSDVVQAGAVLVWALIWLEQRFTDARALLDEIRPFAIHYPEGRAWFDFHAALLAASTGNIRSALGGYRAAHRTGLHLGSVSMTESAIKEISIQLTKLGRSDEAVSLLNGLSAPPDSCGRATWSLNMALTLVEHAKRKATRVSDPAAAAALVDAEKAAAGCPDPHRRMLAAIEMADYWLEFDPDDLGKADLKRSLQALEQAEGERSVLLAIWRDDVLGRWQLRQKHPEAALVRFTAEQQAARGAGLIEEGLRGLIGEARALSELHRRSEAVPRLKAARGLLEEMLRGIPIAEGRGSFLGGQDAGVRSMVAMLVSSGSSRDALDVARWARAAELSLASRIDRLGHLSLAMQRKWDEALGAYRRIRSDIEREAESDWMVPRADLSRVRMARADRAQQARQLLDDAYRLLTEGQGNSERELSTPADGELFLTFFPAPSRGWFVFAERNGHISVRQSPDAVDSNPAAERLLSKVKAELSGVRRIRLFPYGETDRVQWQAIDWEGRPLIASYEIEYGLDIPARANRDAVEDREGTALIVANPSGDLAASGSEAEAVGRALTNWKTTWLVEGSATREATMAALARVRLFHYAGHAEVTESEGLTSALVLSGNARLELGDLLAMASVPKLVVLSSCEAAGTVLKHPSLMGLAQAFIAAGSDAAVAPTRPVLDSLAQTFMVAFYGALLGARPGEVNSVQAAFRAAARAVYRIEGTRDEAHPDLGGWESLRLLVP